MRERWPSTVFGETTSAAATCFVERPSATSSATGARSASARRRGCAAADARELGRSLRRPERRAELLEHRRARRRATRGPPRRACATPGCAEGEQCRARSNGDGGGRARRAPARSAPRPRRSRRGGGEQLPRHAPPGRAPRRCRERAPWCSSSRAGGGLDVLADAEHRVDRVRQHRKVLGSPIAHGCDLGPERPQAAHRPPPRCRARARGSPARRALRRRPSPASAASRARARAERAPSTRPRIVSASAFAVQDRPGLAAPSARRACEALLGALGRPLITTGATLALGQVEEGRRAGRTRSRACPRETAASWQFAGLGEPIGEHQAQTRHDARWVGRRRPRRRPPPRSSPHRPAPRDRRPRRPSRP